MVICIVLHNVLNKVFTIITMCETALLNLHRYCDLYCYATENLILCDCVYRPGSYIIHMHMHGSSWSICLSVHVTQCICIPGCYICNKWHQWVDNY